MEEAELFMQTVTSTKAIGRMIRLTVMECTHTWTEPLTRVNGRMICRKAKGLRNGLMDPTMMAFIVRAKNMARGDLCGLMAPSMMESSTKIIFMAKELIVMLIKNNILALGY